MIKSDGKIDKSVLRLLIIFGDIETKTQLYKAEDPRLVSRQHLHNEDLACLCISTIVRSVSVSEKQTKEEEK